MSSTAPSDKSVLSYVLYHISTVRSIQSSEAVPYLYVYPGAPGRPRNHPQLSNQSCRDAVSSCVNSLGPRPLESGPDRQSPRGRFVNCDASFIL